jgi:putative two-component system response regulator
MAVTEPAGRRTARIMVADDEPSNARLVMRVLERAGFQGVRATSDSRAVLSLYRELQPDVVVLDLHMPHVDGFDLLNAMREQLEPGEVLHALVLTGDPSLDARARAHELGARDYVMKPFEGADLVMRVERMVELRQMHRQLRAQHAAMLREVRTCTLELEQAELEILERLTETAQFHDGASEGHTRRVGELAANLARELNVREEDAARLRRAAPLHDVGKIGLRDAILLKPGPLDRAEFSLAERHTLIGATILSGSRFAMLRLAEEIALTHHERWDGTGYPRGLRAEQIPLCGRIVAVADVFDALTHARPYKAAWPLVRTLDEMRRQRGHQFDPDVVGALLRLYDAADAPRRPDGPPRPLSEEQDELFTRLAVPARMNGSRAAPTARAPGSDMLPWGQIVA